MSEAHYEHRSSSYLPAVQACDRYAHPPLVELATPCEVVYQAHTRAEISASELEGHDNQRDIVFLFTEDAIQRGLAPCGLTL